MANMIMASSSTKTLITSTPKTPAKPHFPQIPLLKTLQTITPFNFPNSLTLKSTAAISAATAILAIAPPSMAAEIEKAALFDFNLTLPIIVVEFLLLMVALDKIYYTPVGKFIDDRDAAIKEKLGSVKDTSSEVKQLEEQATAILKAARAEITAALNKMVKETSDEVEAKLAEGRKKVEAELEEALASLEAQKEETIVALDSQISALSADIVKKVLPL